MQRPDADGRGGEGTPRALGGEKGDKSPKSKEGRKPPDGKN